MLTSTQIVRNWRRLMAVFREMRDPFAAVSPDPLRQWFYGRTR